MGTRLGKLTEREKKLLSGKEVKYYMLTSSHQTTPWYDTTVMM